MNLLCAPSNIIGIKNPYKGLRNISLAGYKNILLDLSLCCTSGELERIGRKEAAEEKTDRLKVFENPEKMNEAMLPLLEQCKIQGIHTPAAYAPYLPRDTKHADLNGLLLHLAKESIKLCGLARCKNLVVRPLFAGIAPADIWECNKAFYLELAKLAKEPVAGVAVLAVQYLRPDHQFQFPPQAAPRCPLPQVGGEGAAGGGEFLHPQPDHRPVRGQPPLLVGVVTGDHRRGQCRL